MTCPNCGNPNESSSPTGDWCNRCGWQSPCPCDAGRHDECRQHMVDKATENGLSVPTTCCCGKSKPRA